MGTINTIWFRFVIFSALASEHLQKLVAKDHAEHRWTDARRASQQRRLSWQRRIRIIKLKIWSAKTNCRCVLAWHWCAANTSATAAMAYGTPVAKKMFWSFMVSWGWKSWELVCLNVAICARDALEPKGCAIHLADHMRYNFTQNNFLSVKSEFGNPNGASNFWAIQICSLRIPDSWRPWCLPPKSSPSRSQKFENGNVHAKTRTSVVTIASKKCRWLGRNLSRMKPLDVFPSVFPRWLACKNVCFPVSGGPSCGGGSNCLFWNLGEGDVPPHALHVH